MANKKPKPAKGKRRRAKQLHLPNVYTGPEIQAMLGGVSHVTVHKLYKAGKLKRVGPALQQGGGFLYDGDTTRALAETYKPQRNPPPAKKRPAKRAGKSVTGAASKKRRASKKRGGKGVTVAKLTSNARGMIHARRA